MKITRRLVLLLLVLLLMFTAACSENGADRSAEKVTSRGSAVDEQTESPLLWRATDKDGESIYFFGTIHAGDKQSKSVLKRLEPILDECDALAVEFDVVAYSKDLKAQKNGLMDFVYADGTTLEDHISDELYEKLVDFLTESRQYSKLYDNYKLGFWYQLVNQALIKKSGLSANNGMDKLLINDAYSADREILEVESADFQNSLLADAPDEYYTVLLDYSVDFADEYAEFLKTMYEVWLTGDGEELYKLFKAEDELPQGLTKAQERIIEDFNKKLTTDRNIEMVKKAKKYLKSSKTVFFAVGTAHFLGEDGIVALLEEEGYTLERVYY